MHHVIPDIHGHADKLNQRLAALGWLRCPSGWRAPGPTDTLIFLGDFIDRGPDNRRVLERVRDLIDSGKAKAVMGNHEQNAIYLHTISEGTGAPLRERSAKNLHQHHSFLAEFPLGDPETNAWIGWMRDLPLAIELDGLRAVHACWHAPTVARLRAGLVDFHIDFEAMHAPGYLDSERHRDVEILTKVPEVELPDGIFFHDKDGTRRNEVRIAWWRPAATSWREIGMPGVDGVDLPDTPADSDALGWRYDAECPVIFGHYWFTGPPRIDNPHALCLDYSAGKDGPLLAYTFSPGNSSLTEDRIHGA